MKIVWNRVTPFSKTLALVIFIVFPFVGFLLGIEYGAAMQASRMAPSVAASSTGPAASYYADPAIWPRDTANPDFSIAFPIDFDAQDSYRPSPSVDWRVNAAPNEPGILAFTLAVPRAFEPQTNFADAKLTVGHSANDVALASCMKPDPTMPGGAATSSVALNGTPFTVFHSAGAGAGNYYETTSYRTLHAGECWAVEYTIHSTQIANYPASYELKPFDRVFAETTLDRIVGTFAFTK